MTKSICGLLAIALTTAACGGDGSHVSAAAPPAAESTPAPAPAAAAPVASEAPAPAEVAPEAAPAKAPATPKRVAAPRIERGTASPSSSAASAAAPARTVPEYREFTLPAGTTLTLELKSAVASDVSQAEDAVRATLTQPISIDGHRVLPAGTEFAGTVTEAERAGRVKGRARVAFQFTTLRHDSERIGVRTEPIEQVAEATKGEDATKVGVGAGAGAAIGALLGGGKGAAKGAAIGAAAGTGAVLATRGKEVRLEPGSPIETKLAAPLSVRVRLQ